MQIESIIHLLKFESKIILIFGDFIEKLCYYIGVVIHIISILK